MKKLLTISSILLGLFLFTGIASASTTNLLQPASTITYNEDLTVNGTVRVNSIYVGEEGVGGVTYFNGSIVNVGETTSVTIADDLRIDGVIHRGEQIGPGDSMPVKINDDLIVYGNVELQSGVLDPQYISGTAWTSNNDGSGSGLDADKLDGHNTNYFAISTHNHNDEYVNQASPSWDSQSGRISIPGAAFVPENIAALNRVELNSAAVMYLLSGVAESPYFYASLQLPDGATVTSFTLNFWDNAGSEDITATLKRVSASGAGGTDLSNDLVSTNSSGVGSISDTTINNALVDNDGYAYFVEARFSDAAQGVNLRLVSAEVTYTFTQPY